MWAHRIGEHERVGWSLVRALEAVRVEQGIVFREVTTSEQFQAILLNDPSDAYWSNIALQSDERCPTRFESRFRDLANNLCGGNEEIIAKVIENLIADVLDSWWGLIDDGIFWPQDNEFYRFQSNALQDALSRGSAWFGSLSAMRGLLASPCHAAKALQQQNIDTAKLETALRGMKDFGIDSNTPLMEQAFDIANDDYVNKGQHIPSRVGTGHLLLAMLGETDARASQLLQKLQVNPDQVQAFIASCPPEL